MTPVQRSLVQNKIKSRFTRGHDNSGTDGVHESVALNNESITRQFSKTLNFKNMKNSGLNKAQQQRKDKLKQISKQLRKNGGKPSQCDLYHALLKKKPGLHNVVQMST